MSIIQLFETTESLFQYKVTFIYHESSSTQDIRQCNHLTYNSLYSHLKKQFQITVTSNKDVYTKRVTSFLKVKLNLQFNLFSCFLMFLNMNTM